jgi:prepilin-type processing-associated H-X9-DG protein
VYRAAKSQQYRLHARGTACSLAIIAILLAILLPVLFKARENARKTVCYSNVRQLWAAWYMYATDNRGWMVSPVNWVPQAGNSRSLYSYLGNNRVLRCPSYPDPPVNWTYGINSHLNIRSIAVDITLTRLQEIKRPHEMIVFLEPAMEGPPGGVQSSIYLTVTADGAWWFPPGNWHDGTSLSFADGHVEFYKYRDPRTKDLWLTPKYPLPQPDNVDLQFFQSTLRPH